MTRFTLPVLLSLAATAALPAPPAAGGEAEDFRKVLDAWAARRDGRTIRATFSGTVLRPAGGLNMLKMASADPFEHTGDWPAEDYTHPTIWSVLLDPQNERGNVKYRSETFGIDRNPPAFVRDSKRVLFDGTGWQAHRPRSESGYFDDGARTPDFEFGLERTKSARFGYEPLPIFLQAGYFNYDAVGGRLPLGTLPTAENHTSHGYVEDGGRELLVLRSRPERVTGRYFEIWADPARAGEIVSYTAVTRYGTDWETRIEYGERDGAGRVPVRWTTREYQLRRDAPATLTREGTYELGEYERGVRVAAADFHLEPEPGWLVERQDGEGGYETYVQPEPGLPPGDAADFVAPRRGLPAWLFLVCGVGCVAGLGLWFFKRSQRPGG